MTRPTLSVEPLEYRLAPAIPTVNLIGIDAAVTKSGPVTVSLQFSEPVSGLATGSLELVGAVGGTASLAGRGDGRTYDAVLDGFSGQGFVVVRLPAGVARAVSDGSPNAQFGPLTVASADTVPPTVNLSVPGATRGETATVTVSFSEAVTDFDAADVVIGGSTGGAKVLAVTPAADGKSAAVTISGFARVGTVTVGVAAGAVVDAVGYENVASGRVATQYLPPFSRGFAVGGGEGAAQPFFTVTDEFVTSAAVRPFEPDSTGGVRVASADLTGDGVKDIVVGSGPGLANEVRVYDGRAPSQLLFMVNPFEVTFTGGVFVAAADLTGDGLAEILVTPDVTGGPRVRILDGSAASRGLSASLADFFGIADPAFRGGARVAAGDINGDGTADVLVSAGFGGGPRVAGFDGESLLAGREVRLFADFFAYEDTLRNGTYLAAGDLDGDGGADLVLGAGPGGGPRVRVLDGRAPADGLGATLADFFAGDPANRGGVRVAVADLDGDAKLDLVTGPGNGGGSRVSVYYGRRFPTPTPAADRTLSLFGDFVNGVYVG